MCKKLFLLFYFLTIFVFAKAQENKTLDSLLHSLKDNVIDSNQLKLNRAIADLYMYKNNTKAIVYYENAKKIANQLGIKIEEGRNSHSIGFCYAQKAAYDKSLDYYLQALKLFENENDKKRIVKTLTAISSMYAYSKNYSKATEYIQKSKSLIGITKDSNLLITMLSVQGGIYTFQQQLDSAVYVIQQGSQIAKLLKDTFSIIAAYSNIGLVYKKSNNISKAIQYLDSAKNFAKGNFADEGILAGLYNNIAATYTQAKQYTYAKQAFDSSLYYCFKNDYKDVELENYRNISDMYKDIKNDSEYALYLNKYYSLKDSIFNSDTKNQMTELESDYLLNKKDIELYKSQVQTAEQKNLRNILLLISLAALAILVAGFIFFKRLQKRKQIVENQNTQIHNQNIELESLNHLKDRLFSIISHDLRNPLNTLHSYLMLQDNESIAADKKILFKNQTINAVAQTGNLLDNLLTWANMQIKNTAPKIVPMPLLEIVQDVIHLIHAQAAQKNIQIHLNVENKIVPTDGDILSIAIRNILTNAIKYSHANSLIEIFTKENNEHIFLTIKDYGVGISIEKINDINSHTYSTTVGTNGEKGSGLGLFLVKELLQKINTPMTVNSEEGKGSEFVLQLHKMN